VAVKRSSEGPFATGKARRKRRPRPPWGGILGGKPIERYAWGFNKKIDLGEQARQFQYYKMLQLKRHYKIYGGDYDYPIKGVGPADWLPWYELALAIASELDISLRIIDAARHGKTARRWRGLDGLILLNLVEAHRNAFPNQSTQWHLERLRKRNPDLQQLPLKQLTARYYEAKRYRRDTKR
jgi:hypothetical protein